MFYTQKAKCLQGEHKPDQALANYNLALSYLEKTRRNTVKIAVILNQVSKIENQLQNYIKSLEVAEQCITLLHHIDIHSEKLRRVFIIAHLNAAIANKNNKRLKQSINHYHMVLHECQKLKSPDEPFVESVKSAISVL